MKSAFFDTSAMVPLFVQEPYSDEAAVAFQQAQVIYAWSWMSVELETAFIRRGVDHYTWAHWRNKSRAIYWIDLNPDQFRLVTIFNRAVRLRSADAGHLFMCDQAARLIPDLELVTFDRQMKETAQKIGMRTWTV